MIKTWYRIINLFLLQYIIETNACMVISTTEHDCAKIFAKQVGEDLRAQISVLKNRWRCGHQSKSLRQKNLESWTSVTIYCFFLQF